MLSQNPLLEQHSQLDRPIRNSQSAAPKTYTKILPWPELRKGGVELEKSLDNSTSTTSQLAASSRITAVRDPRAR